MKMLALLLLLTLTACAHDGVHRNYIISKKDVVEVPNFSPEED